MDSARLRLAARTPAASLRRWTPLACGSLRERLRRPCGDGLRSPAARCAAAVRAAGSVRRPQARAV